MPTHALEMFLPLDADRLVRDFVRTGNGRHLGVAVETPRVKPIVRRIARASVCDSPSVLGPRHDKRANQSVPM